MEIFYLPNNCGFLSEEVASFVTIDDSKNTIDGRNNGINPGTHYSVVSHDSIRGCVRPLVGPSVGRSISRSVCRSVILLSQRAETSRRTTYFVYTNLLERKIGFFTCCKVRDVPRNNSGWSPTVSEKLYAFLRRFFKLFLEKITLNTNYQAKQVLGWTLAIAA